MTESQQWVLTAPDGQQWSGATKTEVLKMAQHDSTERKAKEAQRKLDLRMRLRALLDNMRVPSAIKSGSQGAAAAFKDNVEAARATLARQNASTEALIDAVQQMERYAPATDPARADREFGQPHHGHDTEAG